MQSSVEWRSRPAIWKTKAAEGDDERETLREGIRTREEQLERLRRELAPLDARAKSLEEVRLSLRAAHRALAGAEAARRELGLAGRALLLVLQRLMRDANRSRDVLLHERHQKGPNLFGQCVETPNPYAHRASPAVVLALLATAMGGLAAVVLRAPLLGFLAMATLIGAGAAGWLYLARSAQLRQAERATAEALQTAQDQGLEVTSLDAVGPAVDRLLATRVGLRELLGRTEADQKAARLREERLRQDARGHRKQAAALRATLAERLEELGLDSLQALEARQREREGARGELREGANALRTRFGPGPEEPGEEDLRAWERRIAGLIEGIEGQVAAEYDEEAHQAILQELEQADRKLRNLRGGLQDHQGRLNELTQRARQLRLEPFTGAPPDPEVHSVPQLQRLAEELEAVTEQMERDASLSRIALEALEAIREEEAAKVQQLFGEGDRVSQLFSCLTDGRYQRVDYEPGTRLITVERDGQALHAADLSHGTFDQLYLALRVTLAERVLGGRPGFFLLDDAFLAADGERLRWGFQSLQALARDGWSLVYFTAKEEVGEGIVRELGLRVERLLGLV